MGKKYIIEIPEDKIADFVGSTHFLMPYMMAGHIGHHDTGLPIEPYTEPDMEQVRKEAYEQGYYIGYSKYLNRSYEDGLSDAWEAARKIGCPRTHSGFGIEINNEIFGAYDSAYILAEFSASEAIEKIRQYEQEKEEQIHVGYEVKYEEDDDGSVGVVIKMKGGSIYVMWADGSSGLHNADGFVKTGRYFPEIAEVLQKMKKMKEERA